MEASRDPVLGDAAPGRDGWAELADGGCTAVGHSPEEDVGKTLTCFGRKLRRDFTFLGLTCSQGGGGSALHRGSVPVSSPGGLRRLCRRGDRQTTAAEDARGTEAKLTGYEGDKGSLGTATAAVGL